MTSGTDLDVMTGQALQELPAGSGFDTQLNMLTEGFRRQAPSDFAKFETFISQLANSDQFKAALKPGDSFPSFDLPDANGALVSSSGLLARGPLLMTFYRGEWCPYCNIALKALQDKLPAISAAGVTLVAVSPQLPDHSLTTRQKQGLAYPVLSDTGNILARQLGIVFALSEEIKPLYKAFHIDLLARNGEATFELPVPASYLVGQDGVILERYLDPDYRRRLDPATALDWIRIHGARR